MSSSAPGVGEAYRPNVFVDGGSELSATMPCVSRHQRPSDVSVEQSDVSATNHEPLPVEAATDRLETTCSSVSRPGESLKTSASLDSKTFISPVTVSPSNTGLLAPTNTRRIGSKFCIDLVKGLSAVCRCHDMPVYFLF